MNKYKIEDWELYDFDFVGFTSTDASTGQDFIDIKKRAKSLRVFGTQKQIDKLAKDYNIDEVYTYEKLKYGSYWEGICFNDDPKSDKPTLKEYNDEYQKKYDKYLKHYKQNKNQLIKINLI